MDPIVPGHRLYAGGGEADRAPGSMARLRTNNRGAAGRPCPLFPPVLRMLITKAQEAPLRICVPQPVVATTPLNCARSLRGGQQRPEQRDCGRRQVVAQPVVDPDPPLLRLD